MTWIGALTGNTDDQAHEYDYTGNWSSGVVENSFVGATFTGNTTLYFATSIVSATGLNLGYGGNFALTFESSSTTAQTLTLDGNISGTFGGSSVTIGDPNNNLNVVLGASSTFTVAAGDTLSILNAVEDGGNNLSVTKAGTGTLTLSGSNTYGGGTTLSAGQLNINSSAAIGAGTLTFAANAVKIDNTSGGTITLSNNNAIALNNNFTFVGTNTLNVGAGAVTLGASKTVTVSASNLILGGPVSGGFSLTKAGNGTLTLSGNNAYTGGTTLSAGTLDINSATAIGTGTLTLSGGGFDNTSGGLITLSTNNAVAWNSNFTFIGTDTLNLGTGAVTMGASRTASITDAAGNLMLGGAISGAFALTKGGAGTLTLSGNNAYTAGTTLSAGTLDINSATAIGTGTLTLSGGSFDNTSAGLVTLSTNNAVAWNSNFTFVGTNNLNLGTGAVTMNANRTATITADTLTIGGPIGDSGSNYKITKSGAGTLAVTGSNTYGGGTAVSAGAMLVDNSSGSGTGTGAVTVSSGATIGGTGTVTGAVTVNSGGILAPGAGGTSIFNTGNLTLASGSDLDIVLNGNTAGSGYDQVNVTGTVTVTGSTLNLSGTRSDHDGTILTLINNDAADAITGTFQSLAQGATTAFSGVTYTASYIGGTGNDMVLTADLAASTTTVTSSANPSVFGQSVTFTADVTSVSSGTPTGTVTFMDGATTLGTGTLNGSGIATFSTSALALNDHSITAVYGGDTNFTTSTSSALTQTVDQDGTTSTVSSSANPSVFGQSVTFTATVTASAPGSGTPTGTVTFMDGATTLGTGTLDGSGVATFSTSALALNDHSITAVYGGDTNFTTSTSSALTQTVDQDGTTSSAVSSSANPSVFGQSLTFTATVTASAPGSGTPTGTVTFMDGATTLGTGTLNGSGVATFSTSALALNGHSITAVYGGDTNFTGSTSSTLTQTVNQDATSSTVSSSVNPSVFGQSVTFTATVTASAPGSGTPTGTVTFMDGATTLGTGTLNGSGVATFSTSALALNGHSITAVYGGDTNFTGSTSSALTQTVNKAATATVVSSSTNPSDYDQPVTFTATVTASAPGSGTPSGTVTFDDGGIALGTDTLNGSGQAVFSTSSLSVGNHSITAVYAGDANFTGGTSSVLTQQAVVQLPPAELAVAQQSGDATAGTDLSAVSVDVMDQFGNLVSVDSSDITLSIASGPAGAQLAGTLEVPVQNGVATFDDVQLTQAGVYVLVASTTDGIVAETAPITINPGPATQTAVTAEPNASWQYGTISPNVVIALADQFGNIVPTTGVGITASIASGPAGAILSGTRTVATVDGYATFDSLSVNLPGIYSLTFASGTDSPVVISELQIVPIPARRFLLNGSPLSTRSILMQQQHTAPSVTSLGSPPATVSVIVVDAATFLSDDDVSNFQFPGSSGAVQSPFNFISDSDPNPLQKFLDSN
ncbi:MAG TPA: Ig-like domain repeat protein [Tepidisphaeraceae bacterium]|nr:Ig-like domain repeat protein [Tepidisphaeraceae bacterium]